MNERWSARAMHTDVLIIGGGCGGVAAALACARMGVRCILTEPTPWIGGQLTSQGVPPDENRWIESGGATESYREFRARVRAWYREHVPLTPEARANDTLNPGGGWVSRLCFEPRVGHEVLQGMVRPFIASGAITPMLRTEPEVADVERDVLRSVTLRNLDTGDRTHITCSLALDATELGDLLELAHIEHRIGAESARLTGELHARTDLPQGVDHDPLDQQALSWCFAMTVGPHGVEPPEPDADAYSFWRSFVPSMTPRWTGPLFNWTVPSHNVEGRRRFGLVPPPHEPAAGEWELWRYRAIVDPSIVDPASRDGTAPVTLVNWVQMDYWLRPLLGVDREARQSALSAAREQSLCLMHWMRTAAPRHDTDSRTGYPELRLMPDVLGTRDGFAMAPYIREPRRLVARTIVTEADLGTEQRTQSGHDRDDNWDATPFGTARTFRDSVGIGHYPIDLHPSCAGRNSVYVAAAPFQIPLGALLPVRVRNVLAAGKCLGVTHVTNGCFRLHPVEWNVGESAGSLAAMCVLESLQPAQVHESPELLSRFRETLATHGVRLAWPWDIPPA